MEPTTRRLTATAESVPVARGVVVAAVRALGGDGDAQETAALLVSELVTNAVLHARSDIELSVRPAGTRVRIAVADGSPAWPRPRRYGIRESTGRGLRLVEGLSSSWGITSSGSVADGGKEVWLEVPLTGGSEQIDEDALLASFDLSAFEDIR